MKPIPSTQKTDSSQPTAIKESLADLVQQLKTLLTSAMSDFQFGNNHICHITDEAVLNRDAKKWKKLEGELAKSVLKLNTLREDIRRVDQKLRTGDQKAEFQAHPLFDDLTLSVTHVFILINLYHTSWTMLQGVMVNGGARKVKDDIKSSQTELRSYFEVWRE